MLQNLARPHLQGPHLLGSGGGEAGAVQMVAPKAGVGVSLGRAPHAGPAGRLVGSKAEPGPSPPALTAPALPTRH